jgi:hypothetical protein
MASYKIVIDIIEKAPNLHDVIIKTEGLDPEQLPSLFNYLTPKIVAKELRGYKLKIL